MEFCRKEEDYELGADFEGDADGLAQPRGWSIGGSRRVWLLRGEG